jgi:hypothetical protein
MKEGPRNLGLLSANLAARQMAGLVVVLDHHDCTLLARVTLDHRQGSIWAERFHRLRPSIKVIIANLANQNAIGILLDEINFTVEVAVALYLYNFTARDRFNDIRLTVPVGVDQNLILVLADSHDPLIRPTITAPMSYDASGALAGGKRERQR